MTETLWAPWRMDYITSAKPDGCIFCGALRGDQAGLEENLVLHVATHAFVIMNRFPYSYAHLMVVPRKHVDRLEKLNSEEQQALLSLWVGAQTVVRQTFKPQGMNLGMNIGQAAGAGIEDHVHAHIVPRWLGDTNFMPVLADSRVMPEHLSATYRKLKEAFELWGESR